MDKLYSLPISQNTPSPKKETLELIMQYAAAYTPIITKKGLIELVSN